MFFLFPVTSLSPHHRQWASRAGDNCGYRLRYARPGVSGGSDRPDARYHHTNGATMSTPRTVLITGGNRGIGHALAERFVAEGHRVAVTSRSGTGGPEGALTVAADITDSASVDAAFTQVEAELGPVEVLVANAGITNDQLLLRMSEEDFTSVVDTNLTGTFRVVKRATKGMMKAKFGRIVLMSSVVGAYGQVGQVNYASSKAALVGMARSITRELGSRGITANVVAPGFIQTDMTAALPEELQAEFKKQIPAARYGTVEDVAAATLFLAGDGAGYVSGAVIPVDGGLGMGH
ncbi:beta-ketoacyl-ACP reductase [Curtobacterium citreum]|nr:3-oxoacyl-[acyl-carrier-protein] reductase [Curtobacterium sp. AG1037]TQJ28129.1 3-oxoacyl-[acyl-carrier-protein] reductase [Curtobacterium citreum]GGL69217.1 beta-ketoacyl-ACP reductase [Curtobacterium citreum]